MGDLCKLIWCAIVGLFRARGRGDPVEPARDHDGVLASLTPREERVLRGLRFGIGMNADHTLREAGQKFSLTHPRTPAAPRWTLKELQRAISAPAPTPHLSEANSPFRTPSMIEEAPEHP